MKLAINGSIPIRQGLLPRQLSIGDEEIQAVNKTLKFGLLCLLSGFQGNASQAFYGGEKIQEFETAFKNYHKTLYAYSCNSCTSALQIACGAIGLQPGDEVIVTPWSMCCSATAPMIWGAVPIFADIEHDYFCLDPKSIEEKITNRTKAIIVVDLFGQPYNVEAINGIANKHGLYVIEDAAQAIGSKYKDRYAGTFGTIGCFSFTQGKHLTAGEGGMMISNLSTRAKNFALIRNHAEAVINDMDSPIDEKNMIGYNMRMTEIQAAILIEQLKKLNYFVKYRQENAYEIAKGLDEIPFITPSPIRKNCTHSFYVQAFFYDQENADDVHRDKFIAAVKAELQPEEGRPDKGTPIGCGYIQPLYRMPLFQQKAHWSIKDYNYFDEQFKNPVVEKLWQDELFITTIQGLNLGNFDRKDIIDAFYKVYENMEELRDE